VRPSGPNTQDPTDQRRHAHSEAPKASVTAHSLCQHDCVSWFRTQRTLVEQGSAPTSHLALHVLLVEDQPARKHAPTVATPCHSRRCPRIVLAAWHVGLALPFQCFMSGTFCHCAMLAGCVCCISPCYVQIACYQPTSCFALHSLTLCNAKQTQTETCVVALHTC
jgi:hypothetical protein